MSSNEIRFKPGDIVKADSDTFVIINVLPNHRYDIKRIPDIYNSAVLSNIAGAILYLVKRAIITNWKEEFK